MNKPVPLVDILKAEAKRYGCARIARNGSMIEAKCFGGARVTFYVDDKVKSADYIMRYYGVPPSAE
jgi:hypothetical protein